MRFLETHFPGMGTVDSGNNPIRNSVWRCTICNCQGFSCDLPRPAEIAQKGLPGADLRSNFAKSINLNTIFGLYHSTASTERTQMNSAIRGRMNIL
jgi:hypothetical protein